jgi:hypothetical protein
MSEEKIYVRFCEAFRIVQGSEPIEVDVAALRKCDPPYEGNDESDLVDYLTEIQNDYDWYEENKEHFDDEDEAYQLIFDEWPEMEEYSDSRTKGADTWLEVGVPNDEYRKTGLFEMKASNIQW